MIKKASQFKLKKDANLDLYVNNGVHTIVDESGLTCSALMDLMTGEKALVDGTALSIEESALAV